MLFDCELLHASVKHAHLGGGLPNILRLLSSVLTADEALPSHFPKFACLLAKKKIGAESQAHTWMAMFLRLC